MANFKVGDWVFKDYHTRGANNGYWLVNIESFNGLYRGGGVCFYDITRKIEPHVNGHWGDLQDTYPNGPWYHASIGHLTTIENLMKLEIDGEFSKGLIRRFLKEQL